MKHQQGIIVDGYCLVGPYIEAHLHPLLPRLHNQTVIHNIKYYCSYYIVWIRILYGVWEWDCKAFFSRG